MNAYEECKKRKFCASVLCWPVDYESFEIRYEGSLFCRFCDWDDKKCTLRMCDLPKTAVKKEVQSWSWNSAIGHDSGENSAECLRKTIKNKFYLNPEYVEALKEMEK
jgi:hypothetical protein